MQQVNCQFLRTWGMHVDGRTFFKFCFVFRSAPYHAPVAVTAATEQVSMMVRAFFGADMPAGSQAQEFGGR